MSDELDFSVVLDDFKKDADKWRAINEVVGTSQATAATVQVLPDYVTDGISYAAGFKTQYDALATRTADYLADGHTALESIAVKLEDTRTQYLASDEYAEWVATH